MEKEAEEDLSRRLTETMLEENDKTVYVKTLENLSIEVINKIYETYFHGAEKNFRKKFQIEIQI